MNDIFSYLTWRGDLSFEERLFNEVDNILLSEIAYINFDRIVPSIEDGSSITIYDAYQKLVSLDKEENSYIRLLKQMSKTKRFKNVQISNYVDIKDEDLSIQFAAMCFYLDNDDIYIAFRGTDETIVGWKEDFSISYQVVPAQYEAINYLNKTMNDKNYNYYIGGHSKGGNLAIHGSVMCNSPAKNKIIHIFNNDGPNINKAFIDINEYESLKDKIIRIVPQFSIIGMLFNKEEKYKVINSTNTGVMQHDPMSWEVINDSFVEVQGLTSKCKKCNKIISHWIESSDVAERKDFTEDLFGALKVNGAKSMSEVTGQGFHSFEFILLSIGNSSLGTKKTLKLFFKSLINELQSINVWELLKTKPFLKNCVFLVLGIFFMRFPETAIQTLGGMIFLTIFGFMIYRFIYFFSELKKKRTDGKVIVVLYLAIILLLLRIMVMNTTLIFSSNLIFGLVLVLGSLHSFYNSMKLLAKRKRKWLWLSVKSLVVLLCGFVALVTSGRVIGNYIFTTGAIVSVFGLMDLIYLIYKTAKVKQNRIHN